MIIDAISDLHGYYPKLEGGDLLIVAGNLTNSDSESEYFEFIEWLEKQAYKKIIFIAGNHDNWIERNECAGIADYDGQNIEYLCDSGTEFQGLKIWGSPWTKNFYGQNFKCKAFGLDTSIQMREKFYLIPNDIDILITHSPPHGILDETWECHVGSMSLRDNIISFERLPKLKLHVFGHIHDDGERICKINNTIFVNASIVDGVYDPVNDPVRIVL